MYTAERTMRLVRAFILFLGLNTSNSFASKGNSSSHNLVFDFVSASQSNRKLRRLTKSKQPSLSSVHYRSIRLIGTPGQQLMSEDPSPTKQCAVPCVSNSPPFLNLDGIITSNRASFDTQKKPKTLLISEFNNTSMLNSNTDSKSNIHIASINTLLKKRNSNNCAGDYFNTTTNECGQMYYPIKDQTEAT